MKMRAMLLKQPRHPLVLEEVPVPEPQPGQVRIKVSACAVCRTDLHVADGELPHPKLPLIPGHEIVGRIDALGTGVAPFQIGDRVGVPWLGWTCGQCEYCRTKRENLCDHARFTGYTIDGGYAEFTVADARFCFPLPARSDAADADEDDIASAPLLCAGLIGYRSLRMAGEASRLGLYGFGAAAHIVAQIAVSQGRKVFAFTRKGDTDAQEFAHQMGAAWAGGSDEKPPELLDAALIFAPAGPLVPTALRALRKGGVVVCGGIHMSDIPSFPYSALWEERCIRSVANLTRQDGNEFFEIVAKHPVHTRTQPIPLEQANEALEALRRGRLTGAAVLTMG